MAYTIVLHSGAEGDIDHAYNWYEDQKPGLGEEFLDELVACYKKLEQQSHVFFQTKQDLSPIGSKAVPLRDRLRGAEEGSGHLCRIPHQPAS